MSDDSTQRIPRIHIEHPDYLWPLNWKDVFPVDRPVELDIGAGDGGFLIQAAERFPERNFFGIERLLGRVRKIERRAWRAGRDNVRVLRMENAYTVKYLLPPRSIAAAHLYHPDPFPKKKQQKRRLVTGEFIHSVADVLAPDGKFFIRTDHEEYFGVISECVTRSGKFRIDEGENPYRDLLTDFERDYRERGLAIHTAQFALV
ncbi:hypothetical protein QQ054_32435 [Oscillatoria amoena NRMC-F 0135]|nr:hypothetical protein [Oscillatoria amoena NRMC-F 0135]